MKKLTFLLIALFVGAFALQVNATTPGKAPMRSSTYSSLPSGYQQLGNTSIYYSIAQREAAGPGNQYGISILGKIGNLYYSSTYQAEDNSWLFPEDRPGAGFIAALQVNNGTATYLNALNGTTSNGVRMTTRLEPQGDVAARIVYTLTNNNNQAVTVNAGVWGDIMIGDHDNAPLERLTTSTSYTYGIKMKYNNTENTPLLCALFGEGVTGVTAADDYWFGFFSSNWHAYEIVGQYSNTIYDTNTSWGSSYSQYYMVENGSYDSGLGFCWKNREIPAGESIELSYVISVGEIEFEEPVIPDDPEPGQDIFTYNIEANNIPQWNDLSYGHPIHIWGEYEHPYGQSGWIEYQVDDENTWHRVPTELVSGGQYDLLPEITFNTARATDHVMRVRFNDGLDNCVELDGLSWIDVRSYDVVGFEDRVYNGQAQVYNITVNGDPKVYTGETNPGTYNYTIVGEYDATIGVKEVPYTIYKAQASVYVDVPDDVEYDGEEHPATVILVEGDGVLTVTYKNTGTGETTSEAPVEPGTYLVIVEVSDGQFYNGIPATPYGPFVIYATETSLDELSINGEDNGAWYTIDGRRVATPTQPGLYIHNGKKYIVK